MCRLYGFLATEPTKVECTLVYAQNALIAQSREDLSGLNHAHGWGVAMYDGAVPDVRRQAWAAYHGEHFARAAARTYSELVIAHVRRATVGEPSIENTHPFSDGRWVFAHNGTVPGFTKVRAMMRERMSEKRWARIKGDTDSEHIFHYFLSLCESGEIDPGDSLTRAIWRLLDDVTAMSARAAPGKRIGLNIMLTDGRRLAGSRINRSLFFVHRDGVHDCEICGFPHIRHDPDCDYRAVVVASEPLTHEHWIEVPNNSVWEADVSGGLDIYLWGPQEGAVAGSPDSASAPSAPAPA